MKTTATGNQERITPGANQLFGLELTGTASSLRISYFLANIIERQELEKYKKALSDNDLAGAFQLVQDTFCIGHQIDQLRIEDIFQDSNDPYLSFAKTQLLSNALGSRDMVLQAKGLDNSEQATRLKANVLKVFGDRVQELYDVLEVLVPLSVRKQYIEDQLLEIQGLDGVDNVQILLLAAQQRLSQFQ